MANMTKCPIEMYIMRKKRNESSASMRGFFGFTGGIKSVFATGVFGSLGIDAFAITLSDLLEILHSYLLPDHTHSLSD